MTIQMPLDYGYGSVIIWLYGYFTGIIILQHVYKMYLLAITAGTLQILQ